MRKQVLVTVDRGETRVAILESEDSSSRGKAKQNSDDWRVGELYIERRGSRSIVGNIYKGKVDNVLPGLEAAFVDTGLDKNGFLHADDIVIPGVEVARRGRGGRGKGKSIQELLKPGQEILVQAVKDPLKTKGPRLSMQLSIAGRYLVYVPQGEGVGVSRRLDDKERDRLRKAAGKLDLRGGGAIIRTAAQGAKREDFEREIKYLHKLHEVLQKRAEESAAPAMVFQEADLSVRVVRDIFSDQFERAIVDDERPAPPPRVVLPAHRARAAPAARALQGRGAAVRALRHRGGDRVHAVAAGGPAERRLPDDRLRRGDDGDRRELRLVHRPRQGSEARGHDHQGQPRGRRRDRAPAAPARHRRDHRHRLHRHVALAQPRRRAQDAAQRARRGPHQDLRRRDLAARAWSR